MNSKVNELQVLEQNSNAIVEAFKTEGGAKALFDRIAEQARSVVPDLSTDKGRKAIASMARKVASTKTAFDAHGKELKEQYTVITNKIDADRKLFRDSCDALRDEIRKPLTDWEQAETDRVSLLTGRIDLIKGFAITQDHHTAKDIQDSLNILDGMQIDETYQEFEQEAKIAKFETLEKLRTALAAREKYEAEQAELERLRQAEIERKQKERDEAIARQAAENARSEAEQKAKAEADRIEREKLEAIEKAEREIRESAEREARLKAEKEAAELREAQLKQQAIEQAKQAEIKEKQAVEAERKRIEDEQAAQLKAQQEAEAARQANKEHKARICNEALAGLAEIGISEEQGKAIIRAIHAGSIPHVSIKF